MWVVFSLLSLLIYDKNMATLIENNFNLFWYGNTFNQDHKFGTNMIRSYQRNESMKERFNLDAFDVPCDNESDSLGLLRLGPNHLFIFIPE